MEIKQFTPKEIEKFQTRPWKRFPLLVEVEKTLIYLDTLEGIHIFIRDLQGLRRGLDNTEIEILKELKDDLLHAGIFKSKKYTKALDYLTDWSLYAFSNSLLLASKSQP